MMSRFKSEKLANGTSARKRRLIGPGTMTLLIVLVYISGSQFLSKPKVTIERHVEASDGAMLARKPSISQLLSWSENLHLTANQTTALNRLAQDQKLRLAPVEASIEATMNDFTSFAEKHNSEAVGLNMIQAKAGSMSQLSRQKRQLEQSFAEQALAVLAASQQQQAARLQQATTRNKVRKEAASP